MIMNQNRLDKVLFDTIIALCNLFFNSQGESIAESIAVLLRFVVVSYLIEKL